MTGGKTSSKQKILTAAEELSRETGPGHLSLDAVAMRAGVSKGGLLYNFPTKAKLLEALVERHLEEFDRAMREREEASGNTPNGVTKAYLDLVIRELECRQPPASGLMAALAEAPHFLDPVRHFQRIFLDRIKENASDPTFAVIIFLALQGIRSMELFNIGILTDEESQRVVERMRALVETDGAANAD